MSKFDSMNHAQLRAYVLAHREDEEAWEAFRRTFKDNPNLIVVPPDLDQTGWAEVEASIKQINDLSEQAKTEQGELGETIINEQ